MSNATKPFSNLTFLVVDDDPKGLDMMVTLLKHYGANTLSAGNGATGLEFARQLKPSVIISDLSMPVMNGWKMIAELKQDRATLNIPIIALTAHVMRGDREKAIAAGCHNYLSKPIDPYNFLEQLSAIIDDIPELRAISRVEPVPITTEPAKNLVTTTAEAMVPKQEGLANTPETKSSSTIPTDETILIASRTGDINPHELTAKKNNKKEDDE